MERGGLARGLDRKEVQLISGCSEVNRTLSMRLRPGAGRDDVKIRERKIAHGKRSGALRRVL